MNNKEKLHTDSDVHSVNRRHKNDLHMPNANLTSYQKVSYSAGIKLFGILPSSV